MIYCYCFSLIFICTAIFQIKVPTSILSQGHSNAAEALEASNTNSAVVKKVKDVLDYFVQKISATAPLGSRVLLSSENPGYPSSLIFRQLLDRSPIFIKTQSKNGTVEGSVRFEEAVREKYYIFLFTFFIIMIY